MSIRQKLNFYCLFCTIFTNELRIISLCKDKITNKKGWGKYTPSQVLLCYVLLYTSTLPRGDMLPLSTTIPPFSVWVT